VQDDKKKKRVRSSPSQHIHRADRAGKPVPPVPASGDLRRKMGVRFSTTGERESRKEEEKAGKRDAYNENEGRRKKK